MVRKYFHLLKLPLIPCYGTVPKLGEIEGNDAFFHPLLGYVMTCNEHEILALFLKLKPHVFLSPNCKASNEYILD